MADLNPRDNPGLRLSIPNPASVGQGDPTLGQLLSASLRKDLKVRPGPAKTVGQGLDFLMPPVLADLITGKTTDFGSIPMGELMLGAMGGLSARKGRKFMMGKPIKGKLDFFQGHSIERNIVTVRSGKERFYVNYQVDGDTLHINEFYPIKFKPGGEDAQKGVMGLKEVRSIMEDLFAKNEGVERITGLRGSGARVGKFAAEGGSETGVWMRPRNMRVINAKGEIKVKTSGAEQEKLSTFAVARAVRSGDKISIGESHRIAAKKDRSLFGFDHARGPGVKEPEKGFLTSKGEFVREQDVPNIGLALDMRKAENLLAQRLLVPKAFFKAGPISKKFEGISPSTKLKDHQVVDILKEHNIPYWPYAGGGVQAVSKSASRKTIDFDNPTLLQVTKWLNFE